MSSAEQASLAALPTSFVGRRSALAALGEALARSRVVTVLGPPGTGKTRLAKELALAEQAAGTQRTGGALFVDLTEAVTTGDAVRALAVALAPATRARPDAEDEQRRVVAALGARPPTLLILDNFEQLVRVAAPLVTALSAAAPVETRILVTSRERLSIPGEALFDLGPLALPTDAGPVAGEAVDLFVARARAASHAFAPDPAELADVGRLVRLLDGLPLAIELAAARVRVLSPRELVERIGNRFGWLTHDANALRSRRATLWEAIDASWALLGADEQRALAEASTFRGGFGVAAAEAVLSVGEGASVLDVLGSLRDKSLLLAEERGSAPRRFTLLASIRDFAASKLTPDARAAVEARHARFYLTRGEALARALDRSDEPPIRAELRLEHENLVAVHARFLAAPHDATPPADLVGAPLRAAVVLSRSAGSFPYAVALDALDAGLAARRDDLPPALVARGLEARGNARRFVGRARESAEDFEAMRALGRALGDRAIEASALSGLGNAETVRARWAEARAYFEQALAIVSGGVDRRAEGRVLPMLAATHFNEDDPAQARVLLAAALEIVREARDRPFEGITVTSLGIVALALGAVAEARVHLREGLRIHRECAARHWEGVTLSYLALADLENDRHAEAARGFDEALAILAEIDVRRAEGIALAGAGATQLWLGDLEAAKARYRSALDRARGTSPDHEGLLLASLGAIAAMEGDRTSAGDLFELAERALAARARPAFAAAARLLRAHADVASAAPGDASSRDAALARAREALDAAAGWAERSCEVRFARRLLERALPARGVALPAEAERDALIVGAEGLWFRAPRARAPVHLHRRKSLQRLLHHLAAHREAHPGEAVPIARLVEGGWPGERVLREAGTERVYTAVATLRRLGLKRLLLRKDDGYLLDPEVALVRTPARSPAEGSASPRKAQIS